MLALIHEDEAWGVRHAHACLASLTDATSHLKTLDPELGDAGLIASVAAEIARLGALSGSPLSG